MPSAKSPVVRALVERRTDLLPAWMRSQLGASTLRADLMQEDELREQSMRFLDLLVTGMQEAGLDADRPAFQEVRSFLGEVSARRARLGFSPSETAMFVFSLKEPLFAVLREDLGDDPAKLAEALWRATVFLDELGLFTTEVFQKSREDLIHRQQQELLELSTPVIKLWDGVVAVPLIGTLDSARTQIVMESLLQRIVDTGAQVAIVDITGVPTVDTLVAQHLLKTVAAARLMGAECVISGIRPQIAQTVVHLGVEIEGAVTKATLADAISWALRRTGWKVVREA